MNIKDASYATVHDYPGGASSLGPRVGMNPTVLNSKVNPNTSTHHLMLIEAMRIMAVSGDHRILYAACDELGYMRPVPRVEFVVSDAALLETYTKLMKELGDVSREMHESLKNGKIERNEVDRMREEMRQVFAAGEELLNRFEQLAED